MEERLSRIEEGIEEILTLLRPVNAHAEWVDGLRDKLHQWRVLPRGGNNLIKED